MTTKREIFRHSLAELIPLDAPFTGFIEPTNRCNFRCRFCPTSKPELINSVNRPTGDMPLDFAKNLINQFLQFPKKLKILNFQYMGEPLLNPHTPEMINYAVDKGISEWYEIQTNGFLLNPRLNRQLIQTGINRIGISVEAIDECGYKKLCGIKKFDMKRFIGNIEDLYSISRNKCEVAIKIDDINLSQEDKVIFRDTFSSMADEIRIEYLIDWNRATTYDFKLGIDSGNMVKGNKPYHKKVCCYPFYTLGITWHGETVLCCVDWSYATSVGNAHESTLYDIWHGNRLKQFRIMHLENRRFDNPACATCTGIYMHPDNIDDERDEIRFRL